ncbi:MAG: YihY/virulence factor BrkB family protein, partial [Chloroflexota bacterium]
MPTSAKAIFGLLKNTFKEWQEDKASRLAAALAYYAMFSLGPLLLIAISVAGLVFGQQAAQGQITGQIEGLVGTQAAEGIQTLLQSVSQPGASIIASIIGLGTLLLGAAGVFGQLQDALNTVWEVKPKPGRGIMGMVKDRFLSFTMVIGVGFLLLISLVVSAALSALTTYFGGLLPGSDAVAFIWQIFSFVLGLAVVTLMFALMYKYVPDAQIAWRDVWLGALVTALLFTIGRELIGIYLGRGSVGSSYGAAGSIVILLIWIYYSAQILFFG